MNKFHFLAVFVWGMLAACSARADLISVDNDRLQELAESGVPVVDVRRAEEWEATGVIKGSHLLTFFDKSGRYDAKSWYSEFADIVDVNQPFILICESGGRTSLIGKWLGEQLDEVYHVERGISGWIAQGLPVVDR